MIKAAVQQVEAVGLHRVASGRQTTMPGILVPVSEASSLTRKKRRTLPAVWMRAGTSKGLYLHRRDLPTNLDDWAPIISRVMGSYDADPKQLNGIGGATSTTSKVAVVSPSARPGVDVDYTFVQVPLSSPKLDLTGNCGNIASGVGPFALDEGLVSVAKGQREVQVRVFNTNTKSLMIETVQVDNEGHFMEDGDCTLPGVCSTGSPVRMTFSKPSGAMTGNLLPSGNSRDVILVQTTLELPPKPVVVSLVDAANPFVLVDASTLPSFYDQQGPGAPAPIAFIEAVRRQAAVVMGLASSTERAGTIRGTPKIAVLREPEPKQGLPYADIQCLSYSMGKVHGSLQLTGAVCLATAACTDGTVAHEICTRSRAKMMSHAEIGPIAGLNKIKFLHSGGYMDADVRIGTNGALDEVTVYRTARRLMEGKVYYLE